MTFPQIDEHTRRLAARPDCLKSDARLTEVGSAPGRVSMPAAAHEYAVHAGYLPLGSDVANGSMSVGTAQKLCDSIVHCHGFTFGTAAQKSRQPVMWLKASDEWTEAEGHTTYVKQRPRCGDERVETVADLTLDDKTTEDTLVEAVKIFRSSQDIDDLVKMRKKLSIYQTIS